MRAIVVLSCSLVLAFGSAAGESLAASKKKQVKSLTPGKGTWVPCRKNVEKLKNHPVVVRHGKDGWFECWLPK